MDINFSKLIKTYGICVLLLIVLLPLDRDLSLLANMALAQCGGNILAAALMIEMFGVGIQTIVYGFLRVFLTIGLYIEDFCQCWKENLSEEDEI